MPSFAFKYSDFPDLPVPVEFQDLVKIGKKDAYIELFDKRWHLATLEEWEERETTRKLNDYDVWIKARLQKVDILTCCILDSTDLKTNQVFDYRPTENKPSLRSILLILSPLIVDELYSAYQVLKELAIKEYNEKYGAILEKVKTDFFVSNGGSLKNSDSPVQQTQAS